MFFFYLWAKSYYWAEIILSFVMAAKTASSLSMTAGFSSLLGNHEYVKAFLASWKQQPHKVCHEKNFSNSGADISVSMHFTENLKVPAERPWKMQTFDMWYIFVGQMLLGLHESNWKNAYWKTCYFLQNCISQ